METIATEHFLKIKEQLSNIKTNRLSNFNADAYTLKIGDILTLGTQPYCQIVNTDKGSFKYTFLYAVNENKCVQIPLHQLKESQGNFLFSLVCFGNRKFKVTDIIVDENRPHHKDYVFDMAD